MKKVNLFCGILFSLLILSSCSNDDESDNSNDIIIGKWRAIEKYESNVQVEIPVCLPYLYNEYKADKSIDGGKVITDDTPEECGQVFTEFGWNWSNLGNNQYRIRHLEEQGQVFTFYKDGVNLIKEYPDGITKIILESY